MVFLKAIALKCAFFCQIFFNICLIKYKFRVCVLRFYQTQEIFKEQDGKMYIIDKDNYQLSEALDFTSSQVRQIEKHLEYGRMDKQYDNWSMFANQNFDILLDEPLKKVNIVFEI